MNISDDKGSIFSQLADDTLNREDHQLKKIWVKETCLLLSERETPFTGD